MKWHNLYIGGLGAYIPQTFESSHDAIRNGRLTSEELEKTQQVSAAVGSPTETAPAMSVWAGQAALTEFAACLAPTPLRTAPAVIVHAVALHTGLEGWNGSAYIGNNLGFPETLALEIRNTCAGSIVGIDVLAHKLGPNEYGLLTAADIWRMPLFDRWASDSGLAYGDGAAAAVLTRDSGPFRIISTALTQNSRFEQIHRGDAPMDLPEYRNPLPISLNGRSEAYAREHGFDSFWSANSEGLQKSVSQALQEAGIQKQDVSAWAVPHFGRKLLDRQCLNPLGIEPEKTTVSFGSQIGHTGAADPLLGLQHLRSENQIRHGDHIALIGIGAGFTWGCAILQYAEKEI